MNLFKRKKKLDESQQASLSDVQNLEDMQQKNLVDHYDLLRFLNNAKQHGQQIVRPDDRGGSRQSKKFKSPTREQLDGYLKDPASNAANLRAASQYMYFTNQRYKNLLIYYPNILHWYYNIIPIKFNSAKVSKDENFYKQYLKACNYIEAMDLPRLMKDVVTVTLRDGVYYGVVWGNKTDSFILQGLNPDICKIVSLIEPNVFQFAVDMSKIEEKDIEGGFYPPEFTNMYKDYKKNTQNKWQIVPPDISICIKADGTTPEISIPPFASMLPALYKLKNIEALDEASNELSNYKILAAKMPTDAQGVPLMKFDAALQYYNHLANNVGDRVGVAMTPFDLKDYNFEKSGASAQINTVAQTNENFFSAAGTSALLHGATNATSGVTKLSIKVDEAIAFYLMEQCEANINKLLKYVSGTQKFKITFLHITVFNKDEVIDQYKGALNYGMCKLQYIVANGIRQADLEGQEYLESQILKLDEMFTPLKTSSTRSATDEVKQGRPVEKDEDIGDAGDSTRDNDSNANR